MAGVHMKQIRKVLDGLKGNQAVMWQGYTVAVVRRVYLGTGAPLTFPDIEVIVSKPVGDELVIWEGSMRNAAKVLFFNLNRK